MIPLSAIVLCHLLSIVCFFFLNVVVSSVICNGCNRNSRSGLKLEADHLCTFFFESSKLYHTLDCLRCVYA